MQKLNLPSCDLKIKDEEGNRFIFDIIRKKFVSLTPEEWVRQHFIHLMINHLGYPKPLISLEFPITYFRSGKRTDILLNDRRGTPFLLVECKAAHIKLEKGSIGQIAVYNKILNTQYVAVTNGMKHYVWKLGSAQYHAQSRFPPFPD